MIENAHTRFWKARYKNILVQGIIFRSIMFSPYTYVYFFTTNSTHYCLSFAVVNVSTSINEKK